MGILYAISILSFSALLWAALSVVRHIRHSSPAEESTLPPAPRTAPGERPFIELERTTVPAAPASMARPFEFFDPREFKVHPTQTQSRSLNQPRPTMPEVSQELQTHDLPIHGVRRTPRKVSPPRVSERLDWAYYNKDLGDLTDPEPSNRSNPPRSNIKQA